MAEARRRPHRSRSVAGVARSGRGRGVEVCRRLAGGFLIRAGVAAAAAARHYTDVTVGGRDPGGGDLVAAVARRTGRDMRGRALAGRTGAVVAGAAAAGHHADVIERAHRQPGRGLLVAAVARGRGHQVTGLGGRAFDLGARPNVAADAAAGRHTGVAEAGRGPHRGRLVAGVARRGAHGVEVGRALAGRLLIRAGVAAAAAARHHADVTVGGRDPGGGDLVAAVARRTGRDMRGRALAGRTGAVVAGAAAAGHHADVIERAHRQPGRGLLVAAVARGRGHQVTGLGGRAFDLGARPNVAADAAAGRHTGVAEAGRGPHRGRLVAGVARRGAHGVEVGRALAGRLLIRAGVAAAAAARHHADVTVGGRDARRW